MSKLFRTKEALTLAQLARAWGSELVESGRDPKQCEHDLIHLLQEDIINGRLDDSGPLCNGARLGLRCIRPDNKAGFVEGRQLLQLLGPGKAWVLDYILIMKEAVLDFAKRHELVPPSWWAEISEMRPQATNEKTGGTVKGGRGKQARIIKYLADRFPNGVPGPALQPRNLLKDDVLRGDPTLRRLDEATLKQAIDTYNTRLGK
jgi:hypothetical protein